MEAQNRNITFSGLMLSLSFFLNALVLYKGFVVSTSWYAGFILTIPMLCMVLYDLWQKKYTTRRNKMRQ